MQPQENPTIELSPAPSPHYEKFFAKFAEIDTLDLKEWKINHLLGYFCKLYKSTYDIDYTFRFDNKSPSKSYEVFQMNKLGKMLSKQPTILKDYIDWFYKEKLILKKKRITSMAFMTDANTVNEYKMKYLMPSKNISIDRTTKLPSNTSGIVKKFLPDITTYGDLSFAKRIIDTGSAEQKYLDMFSELTKSGFDVTLLDKVK